MALRPASENQEIAERIHSRLREQIAEAVSGTPVPASFVAGLVSVENSACNPVASRFERGVFEHLQDLRDRRFTLVQGERRDSYNGVTYLHVKNTPDGALKNLATSWGYTQILGLWAIHLECRVSDLRDSEQHLGWTVRMLLRPEIISYVQRRDWPSVYRWWNSGNVAGSTADPVYVKNAIATALFYQTLRTQPSKEVAHG